MDYLCHHCYTRTAVAFAKDSTVRHLDADGDEIVQPKEKGILADRDVLELSKETLREAELRNGASLVFSSPFRGILMHNMTTEIRVKILSGHVDDAIELLNEHFPSVLGPPTPSSKSGFSPYPSALEAMNSSKHLIPTTTDPRHLLLNLRILGFTELCRTKPLVYSSPSLRTNEIDMSESSTPEPVNLDPDGNIEHTTTHTQSIDSDSSDGMDMDAEADTDMDAITDGSSSGFYEQYDQDLTPPHTAAVEAGDDSQVDKVIQQGQKLYALLDQIDNPAEKEIYAQELVNVGALLAYPEPENSPLARYLSMERREAVAEQINKAILGQLSPFSSS